MFTAVADNPEMDRAKRATQQQSNAAYTRHHGKQNHVHVLLFKISFIENFFY